MISSNLAAIKGAFKKVAAFTLIEILLIIAIISVIISLELSVTKKREEKAKVEKAALQMQQLLQAGMAYYSDKGTWPQKNEKTFIDNYLPAGRTQDPWGNDYSWCPFDSDSSTCSKKQTETDTFQVMTAGKFNSDIAERIRGMLPNASVKGTSPSAAVYVQISLQPVFLAKTDFLKGPVSGDTFKIQDFKCPVGYISKIHLTLQDFTANERKDNTTTPAIPLKLPVITVETGGGCDGSGTCKPYQIDFDNINTSELYSTKVEEKTSGFFHIEYSGAFYDFYKSYKLNYDVYCCRITGPSQISSYCPN